MKAMRLCGGFIFSVLALTVFCSVGSAQNLIRNGSFDDPEPIAPPDLPLYWTGDAFPTNDVGAYVPGLTTVGFAAGFDGAASLRQALDFSAAGLTGRVVTKWSLSFDVYNPDTEVLVSIGAGMWHVAAMTWATDLMGVSVTTEFDIYTGDQIVFDTSALTGKYTFIDNVKLDVLETRPVGSIDTPTPTPTHTFTPTVTGTPPTETPTPTATETPTPEGDTATPTVTPTMKRDPVGIIVAANPSLLFLPVGTTDWSDPAASGIQSLITVELIAEDGGRMDIRWDEVEADILETGTEVIGTLEDYGPREDGIYELAFHPTRPGMAVIRVTFSRITEAAEYTFTETVNVQVRKDRSGSVLGTEGVQRGPRLNPPNQPALYIDIIRG